MKIAVIGASGFVGESIVKEALQRNNEVLAIARNTEKLAGLNNSNLTLKSININNINELAQAIKGYDTVISAYNSGWKNPNIYNDNIKGFNNIEKAVKQAQIGRFIFIGGAGILFINGQQIVDSPDFPAEIKPGALSCRDYFNVLKQENDLNWTYFAPAPEMHPGINNGRTGKYRIGTDTPIFDENGQSKLSVEDLSVAIIDEIENKQFIKKQFTAAY